MDFTAHFRGAYRLMWLIACGVVRDRTLADDVVQEAAIVALGKWDQFTPGTSFNAWMGQIVRYVAMNVSRGERKRRAVGLDPETIEHRVPPVRDAPDPEPPTVGPGGRLPEDQRHFDDEVMRALGTLSDTARACLLLRTVEGLGYARISELLDIPEGTAMSHVHRSRRALRRLLDPAGKNAREARRGG